MFRCTLPSICHPFLRLAWAAVLFPMMYSQAFADNWNPFKADDCKGPGVRQYSSQLMGIVGSWEDACKVKPADILGQHFDHPTRCVNDAGEWGEFDVHDATCGILNFKGRVTYYDPEKPEASPPKPSDHQRSVTSAFIEVWVCGNWLAGACSWSKLADGRTDGTGQFAVSVSGPRSPKDQYTVRILAKNDSAAVMQLGNHKLQFYEDLGPPKRAPPDGNFSFDRDFLNTGDDGLTSMYLNGAQKLQPALAFVQRFRDPKETDTVHPAIVNAIPQSDLLTASFSNSGNMNILAPDMFKEETLDHEYGHIVQEGIGAYYLWPSLHDGCRVTSLGNLTNSPEVAWFEGFPTFFARALRIYYPENYSTKEDESHLGGISAYTPPACDIIGTHGFDGRPIGPDSIEQRVTDALFLLMLGDTPASCSVSTYRLNPEAYRDCAAPLMDARTHMIMGIFDKELDYSRGIQVNLTTFREAWLARGGSKELIDRVYVAVGVFTVAQRASPHAACLAACKTQQSSCMLNAHTGPQRSACGATALDCTQGCPP